MAALPKEQADLYWNVFRNFQDGIKADQGYDYSREVLTYVQADPRYISYLQDYLSTSTLPEQEKTAVLARAQDVHTRSNATLNDDSYSYSTTIQGMANDLYTLVENNDRAALGSIADAPRPTPAIPEQVITTPMGDVASVIPAVPEQPVEVKTPVAEPIVPQDFQRSQEEMNAIAAAEEKRKQEGAARLAEQQRMAQQPAEVTGATAPSTSTDYTVKRGDNLWRIAKEFYGLDKDKDIARAVETIAQANGLTEGTRANHIRTGQTLQLPDSPIGQQPANGLDWRALDRETQQNRTRVSPLNESFSRAVDNVQPEQRPVAVAARPVVGMSLDA